ncbi:hypothetical protein BKA65DRAFT_514968 [Rhexocercosporidium sp. MPI-PUGE-AT-0058]|nr:hypothetical protein BKA65DRAFT_514968 [Rhexocercosporidium sp. MPI-PUGE-AT-0058]
MTENQGGSCEPCKRKKCKCDRQLPSCGQCDASKLSCTYVESNKRGIPTGYLGLLEQRLGETEVLLYQALSELQTLKLQNIFQSVPRSPAIPDPIPREVNPSKQVRMEEWREYPLRTADEVERWRRFLGGDMKIPDVYDGLLGEQSRQEHQGYHSPPNQPFSDPNLDQDPPLTHQDNSMDFDVANGLMGLSQTNDQNQTQYQQTTNTNSDPPPTQLSAILNPANFPSPPSGIQHTHNLSHTTNYTADFNPSPAQDMSMNHGIADTDQARRDPGPSGGWEASPLTPGPSITRQHAALQKPTELVRSQQLSAAFKNIYY